MVGSICYSFFTINLFSAPVFAVISCIVCVVCVCANWWFWRIKCYWTVSSCRTLCICHLYGSHNFKFICVLWRMCSLQCMNRIFIWQTFICAKSAIIYLITKKKFGCMLYFTYKSRTTKITRDNLFHTKISTLRKIFPAFCFYC